MHNITAKSSVRLRMAVGLGALFEGFVYRRLFTSVAMVNSVNMRSTAWPLSHMCNVTANQRSTVKLSAVQSGVNCSMEEKVNVAVCDSRSSIYNIIEGYII